MLRTPFSFNATVSTAVANKISSSTKTQSDLYEEIADAVVAEAGKVGLPKTMIVPEVIHHIAKQIEKDQGSSLNEETLAKELFEQVKRIRGADKAILPKLPELFAGAAVGLQDSLALQTSKYDMPKAVLHLVHKLATDVSSLHANAEAAVYATVCYLDTIKCPPDAVFTGAEKSIDDQLTNLGTSTPHQKTSAMRIFLQQFYPAFNATSSSSKTSTATKPVMGGIVDYEAWTGGKPLANWSGLDLSVPQAEPHATQVRATSSKASTAMTKRTEGLFYEKEDKFKHGDDLAYFNDNLFEFFKLHGMDTITYRKDPTGTGLMHSVITDYPRFTVESVADQWKNVYEAKYDKYDKQNDYSAKRCFLSSLEESLHKNILAKINDTMTFPEVFLTFVQHEIPISHEKYESVERSIINFDVTQYPGLNVTAMTIELRRLIKTLVIARMWDSKNNSQLCRTLIDAGGDASNQEYLAEMYTMLAKVKKEIAKTGHLNNDDKIKHMTKNDVGWEDILKLADTLYSGMATPGQVRWPPALNPRDSKTPSAKFSVNLTQFKGHEQRKGKPYKKSNGNGHQNGNGKPRSKQDKPKDKSISKSKRDKGKSSTSKFCPPSITDQPFNHVNGTPIYCRTINDKKYEWCTTCNRWSTTHNTATHTGKRSGQNGNSNGNGNGNNGSNGNHASNVRATAGLSINTNAWATARPSAFMAVLNTSQTKSPNSVIQGKVHDNTRWSPPRWTPPRWSPPREWNASNKRSTSQERRSSCKKHSARKNSKAFVRTPSFDHKTDVAPRVEQTLSTHTIALAIIALLAMIISMYLQFNWWHALFSGFSAQSFASILALRLAQTSGPILWILLTIASLYGQRILYWMDPSTFLDSMQYPPRTARRHQSHMIRRRNKKHAKFKRKMDVHAGLRPTQPPHFIRLPKHQFSEDPRRRDCPHQRSRPPPQSHIWVPHIRPLDVSHGYRNAHHAPRHRPGRPIHRRTRNYTSSRSASPVNRLNRLITGVIKERRAKLIRDMNRYENDRTLLAQSTLQETLAQLCSKCKHDITTLRSLDNNDSLGHDYDLKKAQLSTRADLTQDEIEILARAKDWQLTSTRIQPHCYVAADQLNDIIETFPKQYETVLTSHDTFDLIWDSGASMCVTNDKDDFIDMEADCTKSSIQGLGSNLDIKGKGTVEWSVTDTTGKLRHFHLPAYYVPNSPAKLLSTSVFCARYPSWTIAIKDEMWTLKGRNNVDSPIDIYVSKKTNLPTSTCYKSKKLTQASAFFTNTVAETHKANINLNEPQKEILRWHYRLGHVGLRTVQFIMRNGSLASSQALQSLHTRASKLTTANLPKCAACQFGRQTNRAKPGSVTTTVREREGITSANKTHPGERVFIDHFVCATRGRMFNGRGIRDPKGKTTLKQSNTFSGGCMIVDGATGYVDVQFQSYFNANETIEALQRFETLAADNGIIVKEYQSDSGPAFTSDTFRKHLLDHGRNNRYSGAGSHHQNGKAERAIRTIMAMARTMLMHSSIHWPEICDPTMWPMAVQHAVWIYNHIPNPSNGLAPIDMWSKTKFPMTKLQNLHVFGSPVYILDKRIADGKSVGRWQPRSHRGVYMGMSSEHNYDVPLILNIDTGYINAQWNVTFDDWFTTVSSNPKEVPDFTSDEWSRLFTDNTYHFPHDDPSDEIEADDLSTDIYRKAQAQASVTSVSAPQVPSPPVGISKVTQLSINPNSRASQSAPIPSASLKPPMNNPKLSQASSSTSKVQSVVVPPPKQPTVNVQKPSPPRVKFEPAPSPSSSTTSVAKRSQSDWNVVSRPKRNRRAPDRLTYSQLGGSALMSTYPEVFDCAFDAMPPVDNITGEHIVSQCAVYLSLCAQEGTVEIPVTQDITAYLARIDEMTPTQFDYVFKAAKNKNPDILTYDETLRDLEHLKEWMDAALKEIKQLESKECWTECRKSDVPKGIKIVPCTWVFRYKRNPAGEIIKCKGRICIRGDLMEGDEESYAPVSSWSSIRLFLILAMMWRWVTISVDWNNAFIQAVLKEPMYMATPRGFHNKYGTNGCLCVTKSLYGSRYAPRNWYLHLRQGLLSLGLKECPYDKCLFYRHNLLMVLYVDDAGIAAPTEADVHAFIQELRDIGFDLDVEGKFNEYLGVGIEELPDGTRHMTQKGLIDKILETTKMTDCNPNHTPCPQVALGKDLDGTLYDQKDWNYASIVGMLLYVSNNTRPDITFAVSQVARFTAAPKVSHAKAIKTIVRYLAGTRDKGILVKPNGTYELETWVDADFAGLHGREHPDDKNSVKSRLGYIITFGGIPLIWKSQLISEICNSTLHAEYVALANALRTLIPIRALLEDVLEFFDHKSHFPKLFSKVWEDNQGALSLATTQKPTSRTKYFDVKLHFFWSYVYNAESNPDGWLHIDKCTTELMNADYLTKGLGRQKFEANRQRAQGW